MFVILYLHQFCIYGANILCVQELMGMVRTFFYFFIPWRVGVKMSSISYNGEINLFSMSL